MLELYEKKTQLDLKVLELPNSVIVTSMTTRDDERASSVAASRRTAVALLIHWNRHHT